MADETTCREFLGAAGWCPRPGRTTAPGSGESLYCWPHADERRQFQAGEVA